MRYTVITTPAVRRDLARIWANAADKQAVTDASNRIDRELRIDPETKGVPFFGDWLRHDPPLSVVYTLSPDDRTVVIHQLWHD